MLIVSASAENVPHVPAADRFSLDHLGYEDDHIQHLSMPFGFSDEPDLPEALRQARDRGLLDADAGRRRERVATSCPGGRSAGPRPTAWPSWRKVLFLVLAHNAADPTAYFGLPVDRTVTMGSPVDV